MSNSNGGASISVGNSGSASAPGSNSAPVAPIIEPPQSFGYVAPGIYRCSASSLIKGLSPAPKRWFSKQQPKFMQTDSSRTITTTQTSNTSFLDGDHGDAPMWTTSSQGSAVLPTTPTEAFLSSLQLRMVLLLAPEKMPFALAAWCSMHNIKLVHLGLGALADSFKANYDQSGSTSFIGSSKPVEGETSTRERTTNGLHAHSAADMMSLERIAKESLELLLNKSNLPCLVCDMSGVNETGIVVACLRRLQRYNFASIRLEYRSFAGNRARSSHERFIEGFDTDIITLPATEELPVWLSDQIYQDFDWKTH
jgi:Tyrosine phosphatase family